MNELDYDASVYNCVLFACECVLVYLLLVGACWVIYCVWVRVGLFIACGCVLVYLLRVGACLFI